MNQVLYRKYRAQNFSQIRGQEHVVPILVESIVQGKVSHAYLFSGPRGTGKTSIARLMAKAINCEQFLEGRDVCNSCIYCESINLGNAIDIIEMDAASNRGIEEIRSLKDTVNFMPNFLKKKIYIIDEAHMLTKEAFNALLKTLEEPPEHVVFILATTEAHKLPITILSRVTRFDFKFGTQNDVVDKLSFITKEEGIDVDSEGLELIFKYSGGSFRDSESLLGKIILSTSKSKITLEDIQKAIGIVSDKVITELLNTLLSSDKDKLLKVLDELFENETNINIVVDQMLAKTGDLIMEKVNSGENLNFMYKLANFLVKVKADLRDFHDKALVFKIELLRFLSLLESQVTEVSKFSVKSDLEAPSTQLRTGSSSKPEVKSELSKVEAGTLKSEVSPEGLQASDFSTSKKNDIKYFLERLLEEAGKVSMRLKALLKASNINLVNNTLNIANSNKLNVGYLSKKESRDIITHVMNEVFDKQLNLQFSVEESAKAVEEKKEEVYNPKEKDEVKKEIKDNSKLVEELF